MKNRALLFLLTASLPFCLFAQDAEEAEPAYRIFSIYFGGGSYYIDSEQEQALYDWLDGIPELENHEIIVHGHTDNIGSVEYNRILSQYRCESTVIKLMLKSIPRETIIVEDFGEENPIYNNETWNGKLHNRRVDVIIKPIAM